MAITKLMTQHLPKTFGVPLPQVIKLSYQCRSSGLEVIYSSFRKVFHTSSVSKSGRFGKGRSIYSHGLPTLLCVDGRSATLSGSPRIVASLRLCRCDRGLVQGGGCRVQSPMSPASTGKLESTYWYQALAWCWPFAVPASVSLAAHRARLLDARPCLHRYCSRSLPAFPFVSSFLNGVFVGSKTGLLTDWSWKATNTRTRNIAVSWNKALGFDFIHHLCKMGHKWSSSWFQNWRKSIWKLECL